MGRRGSTQYTSGQGRYDRLERNRAKDYMIWVHSGHNAINQDSLLSQIFREAELKQL